MSVTRRHFLSLMYHNVVPDGVEFADLSPSVTSYFVDASAFARQMERLTQAAVCLRFGDLETFFGFRPSSELHLPPERLPVFLTFDDGWVGSVELAAEVLEEHGLCAMVFVTTGLIGQPRFVGRELLKGLPRQVLPVGSHGHSHRFLTELPTEEIRDELQTSKAILEDTVGYEVTALSVPGGAVDDRVADMARQCGYRYVFTSRIGLNTVHTGPWQIGRIAVKRSTSSDRFERWLRGDFRAERFRSRLAGIIRWLIGRNGYAALRRRMLKERSGQLEMIDLYRAGLTAPKGTSLGCEAEPAVGEMPCVGG